MGYKITYVLDPFAKDQEVRTARTCTLAVLEALTRANVALLRQNPAIPRLADASIRFDEALSDHWGDIDDVMQKGAGSPEALAAWRAAELRVRSGDDARAVTLEQLLPGKTGRTVRTIVRHGSGKGKPPLDGSPSPARTLAFVPRRIVLELGCFRAGGDRAVAHQAVAQCLRGLTLCDMAILRARPGLPMLYQSGVRYEEEPPGQDDWQDVPTTASLGYGDCEDLACWRAAELQVRERILAWPTFLWRARPKGGLLYHIQTRYPDGRVEDPSRRLGMR